MDYKKILGKKYTVVDMDSLKISSKLYWKTLVKADQNSNRNFSQRQNGTDFNNKFVGTTDAVQNRIFIKMV